MTVRMRPQIVFPILIAVYLSMAAGHCPNLCAQTEIEEWLDFETFAYFDSVSSDTLFGSPGDTLGPMVVGVIDYDGNVIVDTLGNPIPIPVRFEIVGFPEGATGQTLIPGDSSSVIYTDSLGRASATLVLGDLVGSYFVSATSEVSGDYVGFAAFTPGVSAHIDVQATSPHQANGIDASTVVVSVSDFLGNPVIGADIVVSKVLSQHFVDQYQTMDNNDGTYTAFVTSTGADSATIGALDTATGREGNTRILFEVGPADHIVLTATEPRDSEPKSSSDIVAYAADAFGNKILPPTADIIFSTDLGIVDSVIVDEGYFRAVLSSTDLGVAEVIATDMTSGIADSVEVIFPAMYSGYPQDPAVLGSSFTVPINIYVARPDHALGYYDLAISFNGDITRFAGVSDPDPGDEFGAPNVEVVSEGMIRIRRRNRVSMVSPTGSVDIASIIFECTGSGSTSIEIGLWQDSEFSLLNTNSRPLRSTPTHSTGTIHQKKKAEVCLKVFVETPARRQIKIKKAEIEKDIEDAEKIINDTTKACCKCKVPYTIDITWDGKPIKFTRKDYNIKRGYANKLDVWNKEVRNLFEKTKAKRDEKCINLYYLQENVRFYSGSAGGSSRVSFKTGENEKIKVLLEMSGILFGRSGRDYTHNKGLAHELAHFLSRICSALEADLTKAQWDGQSVLDKSGAGTPNLMEYSQVDKRGNDTKKSGTKLNCPQCEKIIRKKKYRY